MFRYYSKLDVKGNGLCVKEYKLIDVMELRKIHVLVTAYLNLLKNEAVSEQWCIESNRQIFIIL